MGLFGSEVWSPQYSPSPPHEVHLNAPSQPVPLQVTHLMPVPASAMAARAAVTIMMMVFMVLSCGCLFFVACREFPGGDCPHPASHSEPVAKSPPEIEIIFSPPGKSVDGFQIPMVRFRLGVAVCLQILGIRWELLLKLLPLHDDGIEVDL